MRNTILALIMAFTFVTGELPDGIGAIAVVADPAGHPIGLYSRAAIAPGL